MKDEADVCVIGSGAGGGPVAATLAEAGYSVVVLEKGPWFQRDQFLKDEVLWCRRPTAKPGIEDEPHVEQWDDKDGKARAMRTDAFWYGNLVGGSSVFMSGFFLRMKPEDFRVRSTCGPVEGSTVVDWPISYDDLEPYYARAEREVGVSGRIVDLPDHIADRRSTPAFPFPATAEHPLAKHIDEKLESAGAHPFPMPRAILSRPHGDRNACEYAGYCANYGCTSGAKGSALEAFVPRALATGRTTIRPRAMVTRLESDETGKVTRAHYVGPEDVPGTVEARVFVVACQAIESARLLLKSPGPKHPKGLANGNGLVGRNLIFSVFGGGVGQFPYDEHPEFDVPAPFVNRAVQDWYTLPASTSDVYKGGTINFLPPHPNPINAALSEASWWGVEEGEIVFGAALKARMAAYFHRTQPLKFEVFGEWLPHDDAWVRLDQYTNDRFGQPVARVKAARHPRSLATAQFLVDRGNELMQALGARDIRAPRRTGTPSTNLQAGTCRFGTDPADVGSRPGLPRARGGEPVRDRRQLHAERRLGHVHLHDLRKRPARGRSHRCAARGTALMRLLRQDDVQRGAVVRDGVVGRCDRDAVLPSAGGGDRVLDAHGQGEVAARHRRLHEPRRVDRQARVLRIGGHVGRGIVRELAAQIPGGRDPVSGLEADEAERPEVRRGAAALGAEREG